MAELKVELCYSKEDEKKPLEDEEVVRLDYETTKMLIAEAKKTGLSIEDIVGKTIICALEAEMGRVKKTEE